jgi:hypothetical protein
VLPLESFAGLEVELDHRVTEDLGIVILDGAVKVSQPPADTLGCEGKGGWPLWQTWAAGEASLKN